MDVDIIAVWNFLAEHDGFNAGLNLGTVAWLIGLTWWLWRRDRSERADERERAAFEARTTTKLEEVDRHLLKTDLREFREGGAI